MVNNPTFDVEVGKEKETQGRVFNGKRTSTSLSKTIMLKFLMMKGAVHLLLTHDTPETNRDPCNAGEERRVVGSSVTAQSVGAVAFTIWADNRVLVVDAAVEEVEDVAAQDGCEGHGAPVLGDTADTEGVGD